MIYTHNISPFIIEFIPGFGLRWYGFMYVFGFFLAYWFLSKYKIKLGLDSKKIEDLLFAIILGVLLGGRLGYMFLYGFKDLLSNPLEIFYIWHGGMSIHGGMIGVALALFLFCRKYKIYFQNLLDFVVVPTSFAVAFGRIGNFINGELWGYPTGTDWGVIFPLAGDNLPRHPSQLYESLFLFIFGFILYKIFSRNPKAGILTGTFAIGYGVFRFLLETFFRVGDLGFWGLSLGQIYSIPLVCLGLVILFKSSFKVDSR